MSFCQRQLPFLLLLMPMLMMGFLIILVHLVVCTAQVPMPPRRRHMQCKWWAMTTDVKHG
jgi:hypothetical protein